MSDDLRQWVGRTEIARDEIGAQAVRAFRATITGELDQPAQGEEAPLGFHWCLAPRLATLAETDADGHPKRGDFLPPVDLPRRMWAGGELELLQPLKVGDSVERRSRIAAVDFKHGRSGPLCFVTVTHEIVVASETSLRERHDIVYREKAAGAASKPEAPATVHAAEQIIDPSPVLLFRYSALTFNSHRIHYDADYARNEEGYDGLVVHGPLQATLLLQHAANIAGRPPRRFIYRGMAPVTHGRPIRVRSAAPAGNTLDCWTSSETVPLAMTAKAFW